MEIPIFGYSVIHSPIISLNLRTPRSIVVLPFENISPDPENDYFADGVTEEIINALSKIEGLKVTARTSSFAYKNKSKDIRIIGNELGVSTALEGSIRKSGNLIRISTQLIRTDNGFQVWSDSFNRDLTNIFELQDEISLLIADKIRENFGHLEINDHLVTSQTNNIEAYTLFLKGRYFQLRWNVDDFLKATIEYEKSIQLDPKFYKPYFGLVQCYALMAAWGFTTDRLVALEKANYYLTEGLKVNNQSSEAHFALATKSLWVEWKPYEALSHLTRSLAINPNDSESLEAAAEAHIALGEFEDATNYIKMALEVNPLSANHHFTIGNIHYLQQDYSKALKCFERSLEIDPKWDFSLQVSACCFVLMGHKQALDSLLDEHKDLKDGYLFTHLYDAIHNGKPIDINALPEINDTYFSWKLWTLIYANEIEEAYKHLIVCIESKEGQYLNFQREPLNNPLKASKKYESIVQSVFDRPIYETQQTNEYKSKVPMTEEEQVYYKTKLEEVMLDYHLYASENMTLRSLAERIGLHANKLSWLLNEVLGKNFNEYINGLRVEAFKKKALEAAFSNYSLLGIAYECGFNSKSVFNDFFKKTVGMTPSNWLKKQNKKQ
ncbi:helix-turn-helix domain-containing protein [[Muricauda] lutisoli]|uniref:Tetratricopeptide repeat protein n=1 Tax=[Muricauda] lutisoli TaxID=2816035 RepID=A0ABS3F1I5_9FLAO|nr:tetratricopeptide repeat protein [[Muricauda] lutisoli]MBO0331842.1 tetratricopeptide repeat protein [[Muricauda] lutisoli]